MVERKNITLQESARVMLHVKHLPYHFWAEAMNTVCHVHNKVTLRAGTATTLYELFRRSEVWDLVPRPNGVNVIGTKWIYKNKLDENGTVTRNKARLVAQG